MNIISICFKNLAYSMSAITAHFYADHPFVFYIWGTTYTNFIVQWTNYQFYGITKIFGVFNLKRDNNKIQTTTYFKTNQQSFYIPWFALKFQWKIFDGDANVFIHWNINVCTVFYYKTKIQIILSFENLCQSKEKFLFHFNRYTNFKTRF